MEPGSKATRPLLLFAPGAGAPSSSRWMQAWAKRLAELGEVAPFDYRYQMAGRRSPDRMPVLLDAHREALEAARRKHSGRTILIGKSMGSRIGCHLSLEQLPSGPIDCLVCLGYPLRGVNGQLRDEVLLALRTPILFVQGTRDALGPLPELEGVRGRMKAPNALHVVEGGDHSLKLAGKAGKEGSPAQEESDARVLAAIREFLAAHA
jgi:predicted alpha/beta-hydrolase family hydrolase